MSAGPAEMGTTLFDTAIGRCGVAWRGGLVTAVQLPEATDALTLARLGAKLDPDDATQQDPPEPIRLAIEAIVRLLDGEPTDLDFIQVELDRLPAFERAVLDVTRTIPPGSSLTYGQVAQRIGQPQAAQAVGRALGANPFPIVVPCHRVLGADGRLVGFSAHGGTDTKRTMLLIEGCPAVPPSLFD